MRKTLLISLLSWALAPTATLASQEGEKTPRLLLEAPAPRCGEERWAVKTLADPQAKLTLATEIEPARLADLVSKPAPTRKAIDAAKFRFPQELHRYYVSGVVLGFKLEKDRDFHIVLADPANRHRTMVTEIPDPSCAPAEYKQTFANLRAAFAQNVGKPTKRYKKLKPPIRVTAVGVGFFDFIHGQTGVAKNGFELHPLLELMRQDKPAGVN